MITKFTSNTNSAPQQENEKEKNFVNKTEKRGYTKALLKIETKTQDCYNVKLIMKGEPVRQLNVSRQDMFNIVKKEYEMCGGDITIIHDNKII